MGELTSDDLIITVGLNDLRSSISYQENWQKARESYFQLKQSKYKIYFNPEFRKKLMLPPIDPEITKRANEFLSQINLDEKAVLLCLLLSDRDARRHCELTVGLLIDLWDYDDFLTHWDADDEGEDISSEDWKTLIELHHKTFDAEQGINWFRIEHLCEYVKEQKAKGKL